MTTVQSHLSRQTIHTTVAAAEKKQPAAWGQEHLQSSLAGCNRTIGLRFESAILLFPHLSSGEPE
jgi:hypothetical protein